MKNKKYFIIIFLIVAFLTITGCSADNTENSNNQAEQEQKTNQSITARQMPDWSENFFEAGLNDLTVGLQILVTGTENADGSVAASQIMIGASNTDWQVIGQPARSPENEINDSQPTSDFFDRPDMGSFQDMSEEERAKLKEDMMARREVSGTTRPARASGSLARANGEIIKKDDTTITLKLLEGGSKLVFLSDSTLVLKIKEQ